VVILQGGRSFASFDEAFRATLRERYLLLAPEEIRAAERRRYGRLLRGDQDCYAVVDAYRNFRCHADAFRLAMEELGEFVDPDHSLCVVDLGAGAGNVAAALGESWSAGRKICYLGVEPHAMMRRLGIDFLRTFAPASLEFAFVERCADLSIPTADRYLVTLHYVVHQPGVGDEDLRDWAALMAQLQARGPTCLLSVAPHSTSPELEELDRTPALLREMALAALSFDRHLTSRRMDRRMPREDGRGWVVQPARGEGWDNVRIEKYVLEARGEG
jgi:hypothetical protein